MGPDYNFFSNLRCIFVICLQKRKTMYIKLNNGNPSIKSTRQMKAQVNTTERRKNESQQSTKNKEKKILCKYDPRLQNDKQ
jgi:hypothetical protein